MVVWCSNNHFYVLIISFSYISSMSPMHKILLMNDREWVWVCVWKCLWLHSVCRCFYCGSSGNSGTRSSSNIQFSNHLSVCLSNCDSITDCPVNFMSLFTFAITTKTTKRSTEKMRKREIKLIDIGRMVHSLSLEILIFNREWEFESPEEANSPIIIHL